MLVGKPLANNHVTCRLRANMQRCISPPVGTFRIKLIVGGIGSGETGPAIEDPCPGPKSSLNAEQTGEFVKHYVPTSRHLKTGLFPVELADQNPVWCKQKNGSIARKFNLFFASKFSSSRVIVLSQ